MDAEPGKMRKCICSHSKYSVHCPLLWWKELIEMAVLMQISRILKGKNMKWVRQGKTHLQHAYCISPANIYQNAFKVQEWREIKNIFFSLEYILHNCLERIEVFFPFQNVKYGGKKSGKIERRRLAEYVSAVILKQQFTLVIFNICLSNSVIGGYILNFKFTKITFLFTG